MARGALAATADRQDGGRFLTVDPEIYPLTGLRFVAAFYVFLFHIHIRWPLTHQPFVRNILDEGAIGMSLFFVLSGFVLAYRYADGRTPLRDYLINRFARIYPVYVVAAVVTLPWIGVGLDTGSPGELWASLARFAALIFANVFLIQAWFLQFFSYWNDGASWSIAVEAFFYVILPVVLPAFARFPCGGWRWSSPFAGCWRACRDWWRRCSRRRRTASSIPCRSSGCPSS